MLATIIIITYNSAAQMSAGLDAALALEPRGEYEIIVLDNASQDGTAQLVRERYPHVHLLIEGENHGFAGGVNRAVAAAQAENVLLLNPDALAQVDWAQHLIAALSDAAVGVVGSTVLEPDGRIQSLGSDLDPVTLLTTHRGQVSEDELVASGTQNAKRKTQNLVVSYLHGAAIGFRKSVWAQLGGFDEGFYPAYWEEIDFCERVRAAGFQVVVAPAAVVRHAEASSTGKYSAEFYGYYLRNRLRYAAKWRTWNELWHTFRPAEHARLATAPLLDRRVAWLVYEQGIPTLGLPDAAERAQVRAVGAGLRTGTLPADNYGVMLEQLASAEANSVHRETAFTSRIGALARFRRTWNDVATRWYVQPNFDQQTRYNLAIQRAMQVFIEQEAARAAAQALDVALLAHKLDRLAL